MKTLENVMIWVSKITISIILVCVIVICLPFVIVGDIMNDRHKRRNFK